MPLNEPVEFPANLRAFCQLVVDRLACRER